MDINVIETSPQNAKEKNENFKPNGAGAPRPRVLDKLDRALLFSQTVVTRPQLTVELGQTPRVVPVTVEEGGEEDNIEELFIPSS